MKTSDVLRRAGDISRERGWCQASLGNNDSGPVCLRGATGLAFGRAVSACEPDRVLDPLRTVIDKDGKTMAWNDRAGRTHAEVLIALDAAFVLALQEEGADLDEVFA